MPRLPHRAVRFTAIARRLLLLATAAGMLTTAAPGQASASITPGPARAATIGEALTAKLARAADGTVPVVVTLDQQVDETRYAGHPAALIRALRATANSTQPDVTAQLDGPARRFWLVNAIATDATAAEVAALAADPAVASIDLDPKVQVTGVVGSPDAAGGSWGVGAIHAPAVWSRFGITGAGVRVGSIDTGVDPANPELAGAIAGWHDFVKGQPLPYDDNGHGTHTVGTMVARNITGQPIGVAPGAQVIVAKAIGADGSASGSVLLAAAQWMTDPDGDPATADFPTVINNSWTAPGANNEWFRPMVQTWAAMGIVPVFAAGNTAGSIGNPASYPEAIAVGSLDDNGAVSATSSRSLVDWTIDGAPTTLIKPDITAPGSYITSTVGEGYGVYSGTSMAAPHVAGTIALIKQARPDLGVGAIRDLLRSTATDRGVAGPDLDYGAGALDALAAVAATGTPQVASAPVVAAAAPGPRVKVRIVRIIRRGTTLFVQGRVTGPARLRVHVGRSAPTITSLARATRAISVHAGRFTLRFGTRGLSRGRYVMVVTATNAAGQPLSSTTRALRV